MSATTAPAMRGAVMPVARRQVRSRGPAVCRWIESHCVFTKGRWEGQPFRLQGWQRDVLNELFELEPAPADVRRLTGREWRRRYRRALIGIPKKNGKTELAAAVALYLLCGDNEPQPEGYVIANSDDQADLVFGAARFMAEHSPTLSRVTQCWSRQIVVPGTSGTLTRLSSKAKTKDGLNVSFVVSDETHEMDESGEQLHHTLSNGVAARLEPLVLDITTAGHDLDTFCGRLYQHGTRVRAGEVDDRAFFFRWYGAPDGADYRDPAVWAAANPSYGITVLPEFWADQVTSKPEGLFRRYFLNQWTETETLWLPGGAWEGCYAPDVAPVEGRPALVGWDAARSNDSTAVMLWQRVGDRVVVRSRIWERPVNAATGKPVDGWKTPVAEVMNHIRELATRYRVVAVGYDPWGIKESVQALEAEGLPMEEVPQSNARIIPATGHFHELIVTGVLAHDGDPALARHMRNVVARETSSGIRMDKGRARKPMDAGIAGVICAYLDEHVAISEDDADERRAIFLDEVSVDGTWDDDE